ncbi:hypothetical protein BDW74DRAFT_160061 [Aspergillus multicolor]|uniref:uncharacterized protein n=1 Tax=Aspergillus multicolor TaxID=41759 RepID=UPI003CCDA4D4
MRPLPISISLTGGSSAEASRESVFSSGPCSWLVLSDELGLSLYSSIKPPAPPSSSSSSSSSSPSPSPGSFRVGSSMYTYRFVVLGLDG